MADIPFLKSDVAKARQWLKGGRVGAVVFSQGTYQIEIIESKAHSLWPLLQMDDEGDLLDRFCTCKAEEKSKSCPHLAAAYLRVFNDKPEPLHVRFRRSLWNALCRIASRRHGFDSSCLKKQGTGYQIVSSTGKQLFSIQPSSEKGRRKIEEILFRKTVETEESSLKFSNLSSEELALWKEGRPSESLKYELSFWSDLAKAFMLWQDEGVSYRLDFHYEKSDLPKSIEISFPGIRCKFYVAEVNWVEIIPSLADVKAPLIVYPLFQNGIEDILYHSDSKSFEVVVKDSPAHMIEPAAMDRARDRAMGEWMYRPGMGFYPANPDPLLKERIIPSLKIASFLHKHHKMVEKHLKHVPIHSGRVEARYHIFFDAHGQLHIEPYVLEQGDLQAQDSALFGTWAYVAGKGFYHLDNLLFEEASHIVPQESVSDFVDQHRIWLHAREGFQIHVSGVESHLTFHLTRAGVLCFQAKLEERIAHEEIIDAGSWVYIKGRGFYPKISGRSGPHIKPGMTISAPEISRFIRTHKQELDSIPGFFSRVCPIEKSGLHVRLDEEDRIVVLPERVFKKAYAGQIVRIFGEFAYVEKEGFSPIPKELALPEAYLEEKAIRPADEPYFITCELELLRPSILSLDPRLLKPKTLYPSVLQVVRDKRSKAGGWLVELIYETEFGKVELFPLWKALQAGKLFLFSQAGAISLKQPRFNWLKSISKKRFLKQGRQVKLSTMEWLRLTLIEEVREPKGRGSADVETRKTIEAIRSFQTEEPLELHGLQSQLRPYQEMGVRWLWFLYCQGLSGLLCDEMGLGKTHQAMGLLAAASQEKHKYLVICPTSVIYHWQELLKKFLPSMRVRVFYGLHRSLEGFEEGCDLLLTSYGILRSEKKALSNLSFDIAIFDEIQTAKNSHSQTHKALRTLDAKMRLGLTGTPIENRLLDLKALFDIVLPSYLPKDAAFREHFINPIEKQGDPEKKALLSRLIKPFILRRKKSEVLLELPEKIEEISYCDLSDEQRALYKATWLTHREALLKELRNTENPPPYTHIFSLLSTLKQICDHPCLITHNVQEFRRHASGKWDLFVELLEEVRDSGQKLVVFSQYLNMLDIIESYLKEKGIGFAGIRGSTQNRGEQLAAFRDDPACEVFVASLQAAGVGIDLISASVVIHYDRWWNPAKENQATDRVHRIGQKRGVQVFKLVAKNTIEEHIHYLIEKKTHLIEGVIGFDDQDQIKGLDREELIQLLQLIEYDMS